MLRSRFFWKLYASYALIVLLTTAVTGLLVHGRMSRSLIERLERQLDDSCALVEPYALSVLGASNSKPVQTEVEAIGRETGLRVTLIRADGVVFADSDEQPERLENHADRREVRAALSTGRGLARRFSETLQTRLLYVAHRLELPPGLNQLDGASAPLGVVRVSIPEHEIAEQNQALRSSIVFGAVLGMLAALVLGVFVGRLITKPLGEMRRVAEALRDGDYGARAHNLTQDEFGVLGEALNRMGSEITQRIELVSREESQLRAMLASMAEGVLAVDEHDNVIFSNQAALELTGAGLDTPTSGTPRRLLELVRHAELDVLVAEARASHVAQRELVFNVDGKDRVVMGQARRFAAPAGASGSGVVVVFEDVTELRQLERVRHDFVANVSHELKTPLTSIRGFVETLMDGALDDQVNNRRFLGKIQDNVLRLNHLVSDLLSLARIEAAEDGLELEPVDWGPVCSAALRHHEASAQSKGITCDFAPASSLVVLGDSESLTQVIDNLLDNAIKYTPDGGHVTITLERSGDQGLLTVADDGVGIPAVDLERVFERFYRVDKARSRAVGGTGLGLSIVKHLVQSMLGEVRVMSEEGRGTRFVVSLQLA